MKNDHVIDTEGAGDWFSSAFINALAEAGSLDSFQGIRKVIVDNLLEVIEIQPGENAFGKEGCVGGTGVADEEGLCH